MHDVQNEVDERGLGVDEVGIAGLRYPVIFDDGVARQSSHAEFTVKVRLQPERRGTHMSRMVALIHEHLRILDPRSLPQILKVGADELDAPAITISAEFAIARTTTAPASGLESVTVHDVAITGSLEEDSCAITSAVRTDVTSLCPCSKMISDYGAHNQRGQITLAVEGSADTPYPLPVLDAIALLDGAGSAPVIPLVKRPDERVLTMQAYDHPVFVEDMAREVALACRSQNLAHQVQVRNFESIHSHDAVATIYGGAAQGWA